MSDYKPGEMDVAEQEKTFSAFMRWTKKVAIICICVLIFLALFNS